MEKLEPSYSARWECIMVQSLWKIFWEFCIKLNIVTHSMGFLDSSVGKESACNAGDPGLIPGPGISTGEGIGYPLQYSWASLVAHLVKNPPAMQETCVRSLSWEDSPAELKGYSLQYSGLEKSMDYTSWSRKESDMTEWLSLPIVSRNSTLSYI